MDNEFEDRQAAIAHHEAGLRRARGGELENAIRHFERAVELSPLEPAHREALRMCEQRAFEIATAEAREEQRSTGSSSVSREQRQQRSQPQQQQQQQQTRGGASRRLAKRNGGTAAQRARESAAEMLYAQQEEEAQQQVERQRTESQRRQNREAAAAFFEKTREAVDRDDLQVALRRIARAVELHPYDATDGAAERTLASSYREWYDALLEAVAREEEEEEGEGEGEDEEEVSGEEDGEEGWEDDDEDGEEDYEEECEDEGESDARRRSYREWEAAARRKTAVDEAVRRQQTERRERDRNRESANEERLRANEERLRAKREREERRARDRAQAAANVEAAATCVARAREAEDPEQSVRLLRKAVGLRRFAMRYRLLLAMARVRWLTQQALACVAAWCEARGGVRGYLTVLTMMACGFVLLLAVLGRLRRTLERGCEQGRSHSSRSRAWATVMTTQALCKGAKALTSGQTLVRRHPLATALFVMAVPLLLAVLLSAARFQALMNVWLGGWWGARDAVLSVGPFLRSRQRALQAWWSRVLEELFAEVEEEREPPPSAQRQRQRQQQQPRSQYSQYSQQSQYGQHGQGGQRRRSGYSYGEHAPPAPRRTVSMEATLRQRATRLPSSEVEMRRALLARDHFEALGIPRSASSAEAKKAFHKLALKLHPDKNKQELAEEAFKRVEEAHRTLSDPRLRKDYELTLPDDPSGAPSRRSTSGYGGGYGSAHSAGCDGRPAAAGRGRKWE